MAVLAIASLVLTVAVARWQNENVVLVLGALHGGTLEMACTLMTIVLSLLALALHLGRWSLRGARSASAAVLAVLLAIVLVSAIGLGALAYSFDSTKWYPRQIASLEGGTLTLVLPTQLESGPAPCPYLYLDKGIRWERIDVVLPCAASADIFESSQFTAGVVDGTVEISYPASSGPAVIAIPIESVP